VGMSARNWMNRQGATDALSLDGMFLGFHAQTLEIFDPTGLSDMPAQTPYLSVSLSRSR